jgi:adenylate kinase family enzyme
LYYLKMIEVVSFLGVSYSGKSTLAEGVVDRLHAEGIGADIIKKDSAMRALGEERYGTDDSTGGYSISGFLKHGQIPSGELHAWMNKEVRNSIEHGNIVLLEGGTRTRTAQAETLKDIELGGDGLRIFMMNLPFSKVVERARKRRREDGRYDDMLPVAMAKILGQYRGIRSADAPQPADPDVRVLDANRHPSKLVEIVTNEIMGSAMI